MRTRGKRVMIDIGKAYEAQMLLARRRRAQAILADALISDAQIKALAEESVREIPRKRNHKSIDW